jgi:ribonuclease J
MTSDELKKNIDPSRVTLFTIGGCGEFGMNLTCYAYNNSLIVVDCGSRIAPEWMTGVDQVIPDISPLVQIFGGIAGYVLTHGHDDHIGALPYLFDQWPAPIHGTAWTLALVNERFLKTKVALSADWLMAADPHQTENVGPFTLTWIPIEHSIPMSTAVMISTPTTNIFHSGDFRLPTAEAPAQDHFLNGLAVHLSGKKVDLLVADSTNAMGEVASNSEADVTEALTDIALRCQGLIFFTTFSSNIERIKSIITVCKTIGRRIAVIGSGMKRSIERALEFDLIDPLPVGFWVEQNQINLMPPEQLFILVSGSQGERRSALYRIANDEIAQIKVSPQDTFIFSSRIIPGNELAVNHVMSLLHKKGANVVTVRSDPRINASGHAAAGDLARLVDSTRPDYYMPVHGTFSQLRANAELSQTKSRHHPKLILCENGAIFSMGPEGVAHAGTFEFKRYFIDSMSTKLLSYEAMKDRLKIGEMGLVLINGIYQKGHDWVKPLTLDRLGICGLEDDVWERLEARITALLIEKGTFDPEPEINEAIRLMVRREVAGIITKKPVVISKIHLLD